MIFKPYTASVSIRSPPLSIANNTSNPISPSNGCCVSGVSKPAPYLFTALMRRMLGLPYLFTTFMHANIGPQRRRPYPLQKHIKPNIVTKPRVRGDCPLPYLILFTIMYAPQVVACANGVRLPRIPDSRRPPAAWAPPRINLRCKTLRLDRPRALA